MFEATVDKSLTNEWGEVAAAPNTHNKALELALKHLPIPARVLDLPCGAGAFSRRLLELGYDVSAADIAHVEPFKIDIGRRILTDFNQPLPYADMSFDGIVSIEGIEHLENPTGFLRELKRVTVPGGKILLTTPNPDSFRSRRYVLTRGYHRYFRPVSNTVKDSGHLLPVDMAFVYGACERVGLSIIETATNRLNGKSVLTELIRPFMQRQLPAYMRGEVPFYGDVALYVLERPCLE